MVAVDGFSALQLHGDLGLAQPSTGRDGPQDLKAQLRVQHHISPGACVGVRAVKQERATAAARVPASTTTPAFDCLRRVLPSSSDI